MTESHTLESLFVYDCLHYRFHHILSRSWMYIDRSIIRPRRIAIIPFPFVTSIPRTKKNSKWRRKNKCKWSDASKKVEQVPSDTSYIWVKALWEIGEKLLRTKSPFWTLSNGDCCAKRRTPKTI